MLFLTVLLLIADNIPLLLLLLLLLVNSFIFIFIFNLFTNDTDE